ncbi:MAG TPA: GNAT family N-acetyltransferase [Steroidobacteraceae bacterium]|nr:GNAT family N-acetyltransferase [Steroidobacteraceae bacterium]
MIDTPQLPTIEAKRLRLRTLAEPDLDQMYAIFSDPRSMRYWAMPAMTSREQIVPYLAGIHDGFRGRTLFQWGIERREDARIIGTTTLFHLDAGNARAEIGYILGSAWWGQGYMHEALTALLQYAFGELKLRRIEADVDPRNASSLKSLGRLGFRQEGLLRERWNVGGEIQDTAYFGLLAHEWKPDPA